MDRGQFERRLADLCGQGRAIQIDPLAAVDLHLAVEWQVIRVFGDQNMGQRGLGRHAASDDVGRCRGLGDPALARPAGIFGATGNDHPELRRDNVQPFADILANDVTLGPTGAGEPRLYDHLHPLQIFGQ